MRLVNYKQLKDMPSVTWLADKYIPDAALVMIWAEEESFKSFFAVDLACSVATGVPWLGCVPIGDPGPVVYVAAEGQRGLNSRTHAWSRKKFKGKDVDNFWAVTEPVQAEFVPELVDYIERARIVPRLIVVDTYSRCLGGENENDTGTAERFLAAYDKLRHRYDCTLLFIHHSDKYGNVPRGAYAFMAAMEAQYRVIREDGAMTAVLSCKKMKDAERPETITVLARPVDESLVLERA